MSKKKSQHKPHETPPSNDGTMDRINGEKKTKKAKKRFWIDYEASEKFSFVIAVFSVIYSLVTIGLYRVASRSMKVSERAFISIEDPFLVGDGGKPNVLSGKPSWIVTNLKNSGQTPARNVSTNVNYCATGSELPSDFSFPPSPAFNPKMVIAPKSAGQTSFNLPDSVLMDIEAGKRNLFVYGTVSYEDIFGGLHRTEFCTKYRGFVLNTDGTMDKFIWSACDRHNCYDDDCQESWGDLGCPMIGPRLIPQK
jgi:hypothetical protein